MILLIGSSQLDKGRMDGLKKALSEYMDSNIIEGEDKLQFVDLHPEEIKSVLEVRIEGRKESEVLEFLNSKAKKDELVELVMRLQNHANSDNFYPKKFFKDYMNLSWSEFDNLLGALKIFGFVETEDSNEGKFIRFILDEKQIESNLISHLEDLLIEVKNKIGRINTVIKDSDTKKNLNSLKRKLIFKNGK